MSNFSAVTVLQEVDECYLKASIAVSFERQRKCKAQFRCHIRKGLQSQSFGITSVQFTDARDTSRFSPWLSGVSFLITERSLMHLLLSFSSCHFQNLSQNECNSLIVERSGRACHPWNLYDNLFFDILLKILFKTNQMRYRYHLKNNNHKKCPSLQLGMPGLCLETLGGFGGGAWGKRCHWCIITSTWNLEVMSLML